MTGNLAYIKSNSKTYADIKNCFHEVTAKLTPQGRKVFASLYKAFLLDYVGIVVESMNSDESKNDDIEFIRLGTTHDNDRRRINSLSKKADESSKEELKKELVPHQHSFLG